MMFSKAVTAALMLLCAPGVVGFSVQPSVPRVSSTSLRMGESDDGMNKMATSALAAAFILANTVGVAPAAAMDDFDFGSSQVIAGRSGGRAGGRSSAARPSAARPSSSQSRSTTVINRTYVTPAPMYSSPSVLYAPAPVYNPLPGIGLGIGLNAMSNIGNDMRDYRQETEIQRTKAELQAAQVREADMQARLRNLETNQQAQTFAQQQQLQQQMAAQAAAQAAALRPALAPQ